MYSIDFNLRRRHDTHGKFSLMPKSSKPAGRLDDNRHIIGDVVASQQLTSMTGEPVSLLDPTHLIHLQFRRYAGCPICNLHLRSFALRKDELDAAGIRELVVFHSTAEELRRNEPDLPFTIVAGP